MRLSRRGRRFLTAAMLAFGGITLIDTIRDAGLMQTLGLVAVTLAIVGALLLVARRL